MRTNQVHVDNLDDQVDIALHKIALSQNLTLSIEKLYGVKIMDENAYLLDHFMIEKGLIKVVKEGRAMTGKGLSKICGAIEVRPPVFGRTGTTIATSRSQGLRAF